MKIDTKHVEFDDRFVLLNSFVYCHATHASDIMFY